MDIALADGSLWLMGSGIADDIDFTLQLVAVDLAGSESAPQTARIPASPLPGWFVRRCVGRTNGGGPAPGSRRSYSSEMI